MSIGIFTKIIRPLSYITVEKKYNSTILFLTDGHLELWCSFHDSHVEKLTKRVPSNLFNDNRTLFPSYFQFLENIIPSPYGLY